MTAVFGKPESVTLRLAASTSFKDDAHEPDSGDNLRSTYDFNSQGSAGELHSQRVGSRRAALISDVTEGVGRLQGLLFLSLQKANKKKPVATDASRPWRNGHISRRRNV